MYEGSQGNVRSISATDAAAQLMWERRNRLHRRQQVNISNNFLTFIIVHETLKRSILHMVMQEWHLATECHSVLGEKFVKLYNHVKC